jgi:glycosyltransferase involved in cell wall biosynthesis
MFVIDDGSRDATPEIIALLRQEGLDIEPIDRPRSGGFCHSYSTTSALVEILANGEWDAVIPLDADEFLVTDSRAAFEEDICGIPER